MKINNLVLLLFAVALSVTTYQLVALKKKSTETDINKEEIVLSAIHNRKSVRKYTNQLVKKEDLVKIIKAGMAAPSGHDTRPWQFIAITDRTIMMQLREKLEWARGLDGSPAAIVVCGDLNKVDERNPDFWITDTSAATQNILLAIEALGLGGVWSTIYPGKDRMVHTRQVLNLPDHIMPLCVIPLGYPTGVEKPKDKYDFTLIHWEKW